MGHLLNWLLTFFLFGKILTTFTIFFYYILTNIFVILIICHTTFAILWKSTISAFGMNAVGFCDIQLWQKVPRAIKDSSSLEIFIDKVKLWSCDDCMSNLCKKFIANVGCIKLFWLQFFLKFSQYLLVSKLLWFLSTLNKEMYVSIRT